MTLHDHEVMNHAMMLMKPLVHNLVEISRLLECYAVLSYSSSASEQCQRARAYAPDIVLLILRLSVESCHSLHSRVTARASGRHNRLDKLGDFTAEKAV